MHKITVKKQIGRQLIEISVEGGSPKEVLMELGKYSFHGVSNCPFCEARRKELIVEGKTPPEDYAQFLELQTRKAKDKFQYMFVKCLRCNAELTFGEKTTGDVIYLRTNDDHKPDWKKLERSE